MVEDFPRTLLEFETRFATDEACRQYLFHLRWPEGFVCPRCAARTAWTTTRRRLVCAACHHHTSVTAGTIFHDTRKPLRLWFRALWQVTSQKNGASALGVQRVLGLGGYLTAWTWLHKLRRAMVRPGQDRLHGRIEVDETYVGGTNEIDAHARQLRRKSLVAIAVEEDGRGAGRIRMARIPDASVASLYGFIQEAIEPGSAVHTDGWEGYRGLQNKGYRHEVTVLRGRGPEAAIQLLPRVHQVAGLLKRWLLGTHQGYVSAKHLDYYLDEFTFRFNRRTSGSRGKLFYRLVQQTLQVDPTPYRQMVGGKDRPTARPKQ